MSDTTERMSASIEPLLGGIASKEPTPGGGAVAAWSGAMGASLGLMVLAFSLGRREENDADLEHARSTLVTAKALFTELAEEDAAAYEALSGLLKLKKDDPTRSERLGAAVSRAIEVPSAVAATGLNVLRVFEQARPIANPYLLSDLGVAAATAEGAVRGAVWMVRANLPLVKDASRVDALRAEAGSWLENAEAMRVRIDASIAST